MSDRLALPLDVIGEVFHRMHELQAVSLRKFVSLSITSQALRTFVNATWFKTYFKSIYPSDFLFLSADVLARAIQFLSRLPANHLITVELSRLFRFTPAHLQSLLSLPCCHGLESLRITDCMALTGPSLDVLSKSPAAATIRSLEPWVAPSADWWDHFPRLETLHLTRLMGSFDFATLEPLKSRLKSLFIAPNAVLSNQEVAIVGNLTSLQRLEMPHCIFTPLAFDEAIPLLTNLGTINLLATGIGDPQLLLLAKAAKNLSRVTLGRCHSLTIVGIRRFIDICPTLSYLDVSSIVGLSAVALASLPSRQGLQIITTAPQ